MFPCALSYTNALQFCHSVVKKNSRIYLDKKTENNEKLQA